MSIAAATVIDSVHLTIPDLDRSLKYYVDHLGFMLNRREGASAALGVDGRDLLVLHESRSAQRAPGTTGLYHVAILLPSRGDLSRCLRRLMERLETDDEVVTVCPWWDGPDARAAIGRQLADDATQLAGRRWIWAYHGPPEASATSWTGKRHYGDDALDAWIAEFQPQLVLCGHVHQSPFARGGAWIDRIGATLVCNAGNQTGPVPTFIELDTDAEIARWLSLAGRDEREFAAVEAAAG